MMNQLQSFVENITYIRIWYASQLSILGFRVLQECVCNMWVIFWTHLFYVEGTGMCDLLKVCLVYWKSDGHSCFRLVYKNIYSWTYASFIIAAAINYFVTYLVASSKFLNYVSVFHKKRHLKGITKSYLE